MKDNRSKKHLDDEIASLRQKIAELERKTDVVQPCDCCGRDIRFGNACVEFIRLVNQFELLESGDISVTPINDDIAALLCADYGNRYSDPRSIWAARQALPEQSTSPVGIRH